MTHEDSELRSDVEWSLGSGKPMALGADPSRITSLSYPIIVRRDAIASQIAHHAMGIVGAHRYALIIDETVAKLHLDRILQAVKEPGTIGAQQQLVLTVPPGEREKSRERWGSLTDALLEWGAGRDTAIIAIGGGVVCDLAGFVAATFMRGIPVIQVPTTLLAMVDASVGGKTGVDTSFGKNLVGAFHDPAAVIVDPDILGTLPGPVFRSGLAEMLKHGVLADASYFERLVALLPLLAGAKRCSCTAVACPHRRQHPHQSCRRGRRPSRARPPPDAQLRPHYRPRH